MKLLSRIAKMFGFEHKPTDEDYLIAVLRPMVLTQQAEFTLNDAATRMLGLSPTAITPDMRVKIGVALRRLGCTRIEKPYNPAGRHWYLPPSSVKA